MPKNFSTPQGGSHKDYVELTQNLAAMSKEESSMIIVYPYQSTAGEGIAHAAVALASEKISSQAL